jgi:lysozyme
MADAPANTRLVTGKRAAYVAICVTFLTAWEGYEPVAKHERADPPRVITACYGMTNYDRPLNVGERFTKAQCAEYLAQDLPRYEIGVRKCIPAFDDMPPSRQASLISFSYNLGPVALCKSSVAKNLNAGKVAAGCGAMMNFVYANGKYLRGLANRRTAERALCLKDK